MDNWINVAPILVIATACIYTLLSDDWKKSILSNGIIYISVFMILIQFWSFSFSLVKLITGLMSLVILGISINRNYFVQIPKTRSESIFLLVALCLLFLIILLISDRISSYLSIPLELIISALFILVYGILQLGMTQKPYKVFMAILLIFFGFELIYSTNESSLLVNGLLSMVSLLISLVGGYIVVNEFGTGQE